MVREGSLGEHREKPAVAGCICVGAGLDGAPVIASRYDDRVDAVHHALFKKNICKLLLLS
jgi:hypothetical protein